MKLIFVRHGQTVYNMESRYQGHTDAVLSDLGRRQAKSTGDRLQSERIDAIYASDLSRTIDTASPIAEYHKLPIHTDERLRECCFGDWEGLTVDEIAGTYSELYAKYRLDSITHRAPNGERLEALQERVVHSVLEIAQRHPNETVAVVTHGGPIRAFVCHALETSLAMFRKFRLDNCGVTTLLQDGEGRWILDVLNDTCHLEQMPTTEAALDETSAQDRAH